jgi:hypothetical protein
MTLKYLRMPFGDLTNKNIEEEQARRRQEENERLRREAEEIRRENQRLLEQLEREREQDRRREAAHALASLNSWR